MFIIFNLTKRNLDDFINMSRVYERLTQTQLSLQFYWTKGPSNLKLKNHKKEREIRYERAKEKEGTKERERERENSTTYEVYIPIKFNRNNRLMMTMNHETGSVDSALPH